MKTGNKLIIVTPEAFFFCLRADEQQLCLVIVDITQGGSWGWAAKSIPPWVVLGRAGVRDSTQQLCGASEIWGNYNLDLEL